MPNAQTRFQLPYGIQIALSETLRQLTGHDVEIKRVETVSGGCIHHVRKLETSSGQYCLKWAGPQQANMLAREVQNLGLLRETNTVSLPHLYHHADTAQGAYFLLMEWLEPDLPATMTWAQLGRQLACLHRHRHRSFGLHYDNYIGWLPQHNHTHSTWAAFFIHERLERQVKMASDQGLIDKALRSRFRRLYDKAESIFPQEAPALLHGDLWSGNVIVGPEGKAFLIDPATYYGHRECDLAFTQLFGRFDDRFYEAYHETYPLEEGYQYRYGIYNLYPLMAHVNMFGKSYLSEVNAILKKL